jgi:hypothetical protein
LAVSFLLIQISFSGEAVLKPGLNFVSLPISSPIAVSTYLKKSGIQVTSVWSWDSDINLGNGGWLVYPRVRGFQELSMLSPEKGYWVQVSNEISLTGEGVYTRFSDLSPKLRKGKSLIGIGNLTEPQAPYQFFQHGEIPKVVWTWDAISADWRYWSNRTEVLEKLSKSSLSLITSIQPGRAYFLSFETEKRPRLPFIRGPRGSQGLKGEKGERGPIGPPGSVITKGAAINVFEASTLALREGIKLEPQVKSPQDCDADSAGLISMNYHYQPCFCDGDSWTLLHSNDPCIWEAPRVIDTPIPHLVHKDHQYWIEWDPIEDATSYRVRSGTSESKWSSYSETRDSKYGANAGDNKTQYFQVMALGPLVKSIYSKPIKVTRISTPEVLESLSYSDSIKIRWKRHLFADAYKLNVTDSTKKRTILTSATELTVGGFKPETTLRIQLQALKQGFESEPWIRWSKTTEFTEEPVTGFEFEHLMNGRIQFHWNNKPDASSYRLYYSNDSPITVNSTYLTTSGNSLIFDAEVGKDPVLMHFAITAIHSQKMSRFERLENLYVPNLVFKTPLPWRLYIEWADKPSPGISSQDDVILCGDSGEVFVQQRDGSILFREGGEVTSYPSDTRVVIDQQDRLFCGSHLWNRNLEALTDLPDRGASLPFLSPKDGSYSYKSKDKILTVNEQGLPLSAIRVESDPRTFQIFLLLPNSDLLMRLSRDREVVMSREGELKWDLTASHLLYARNGLAFDKAGNLYSMPHSDKINVFSQDGEVPLYQVRLPNHGMAFILGRNGILYAQGGHQLSALSSSGELLWSVPGNESIPPLQSADGTIFTYFVDNSSISTDNKGFAAYTEQGDLKWKVYLFEKGKRVKLTSPSITSDGVVVFASQKFLYGIQTSSGGLASDAPWPKYCRDLGNSCSAE